MTCGGHKFEMTLEERKIVSNISAKINFESVLDDVQTIVQNDTCMKRKHLL